MAISGHQWQSVARLGEEAIRAISGNQWQSVARLGEEAGGFEQAEAVVVHGVLIEDEEDEQSVLDRKCFEAYEAARVAMMATLEAGKFPTASE